VSTLSHLLKGLVSAVGIWLFRHYRGLSLELLKIRGVSYYVRGVQGARQATLALLAAAALLGLGLAGFILLHAGLALVIYHLAQSWLPVGLALLALGLLYLLATLLVFRYVTAERHWMRWSGASRLVAQVTRNARPP